MTSNDIAIAHKDYDVRGGGEVLAEELARTFDAPLYVGRRDGTCEPDHHDLDIREIASSWFGDRLIERGGLPRAITYMNRWKCHAEALYDHDTVILSGNEPLWWHKEADQTVIAYTHSTPRWLYDLYPEGVRNTTGPKGILGRWLQEGMRQIYEHQLSRTDLWVANSDAVARRITAYWPVDKSDVRVVYPPVATDAVHPDDAPTGDYYLGLSRLCPPKRWEEVIKAVRGTDHEFKLAGRGPAEAELRALADGADNVELLGYLDEAEKWRRLAEAKALVFNARNEDFGIVPIEAMAAGTPVIGVSEGFTAFQVRDGENGISYARGGLGAAIDRFEAEGVAWDADRIATFADRFSADRFRAGMRDAVAVARERTAVKPDWQTDNAPLAATDGGPEVDT